LLWSFTNKVCPKLTLPKDLRLIGKQSTSGLKVLVILGSLNIWIDITTVRKAKEPKGRLTVYLKLEYTDYGKRIDTVAGRRLRSFYKMIMVLACHQPLSTRYFLRSIN